MVRKGTSGYALAIVVVAGLALVVLIGVLFGIGAVMGR